MSERKGNSNRDKSPDRRLKKVYDGGRVTGYVFELDTSTIFDKIHVLIQSNGHTCGVIGKKLTWCEQDTCVNAEKMMHARQKKQVALHKKLKSQGHKCIEIAESYPMHVLWCGKKKCVNLTY
jgi:hypothetical protein